MSAPPLSDDEPRVAKRKVRETWREAVARRGAALGRAPACLAAYDAFAAGGAAEHEAAYRALALHDGLEPVDAPRHPNRLAQEADRTDAPGIGS